MKKKIVALILVLAILLVLAAGGFAAWYFFLRNANNGEVNGVEIFKKLYSVSEPTKVVESQTITLPSSSFCIS